MCIRDSLNTALSSDNYYTSTLTGTNLSAYSFSQYQTINPHGLFKDDNGKFLKNYKFFKYNSLSGNNIESLIDWENDKTIISRSLSSDSNWLNSGGTVEKILNYQFKKGISF